jgi:hypothetical protein
VGFAALSFAFLSGSVFFDAFQRAGGDSDVDYISVSEDSGEVSDSSDNSDDEYVRCSRGCSAVWAAPGIGMSECPLPCSYDSTLPELPALVIPDPGVAGEDWNWVSPDGACGAARCGADVMHDVPYGMNPLLVAIHAQ